MILNITYSLKGPYIVNQASQKIEYLNFTTTDSIQVKREGGTGRIRITSDLLFSQYL